MARIKVLREAVGQMGGVCQVTSPGIQSIRVEVPFTVSMRAYVRVKQHLPMQSCCSWQWDRVCMLRGRPMNQAQAGPVADPGDSHIQQSRTEAFSQVDNSKV